MKCFMIILPHCPYYCIWTRINDNDSYSSRIITLEHFVILPLIFAYSLNIIDRTHFCLIGFMTISSTQMIYKYISCNRKAIFLFDSVNPTLINCLRIDFISFIWSQTNFWIPFIYHVSFFLPTSNLSWANHSKMIFEFWK